MQTTWVNVTSGSLDLGRMGMICIPEESLSEAVRMEDMACLYVRLLVSSMYFKNAYCI